MKYGKEIFMKLQTTLYSEYESDLPQEGNWILGQEDGDSIYVYQAYNDSIANYALEHQRFGGSAYSFSRMTWIKPNFLWMMYRAGWATKVNQERILAIKMTKAGFLNLLDEGVYSSYQNEIYANRDLWKDELAKSEVRIQWDPDHDPFGEKLSRRAVQIGIKGSRLERFNTEYIREIIDLTEYVKEQREALKSNFNELRVIKESCVEVSDRLRKKYSIGAI